MSIARADFAAVTPTRACAGTTNARVLANHRKTVAIRLGAGWLATVALTFAGSLMAGRAFAGPVTYTETIFNSTAFSGVQIGLGNMTFQDTYTSLTFTFQGDTNNVTPYTVPSASGFTSGYTNNIGVATVSIFDGSTGITETATFAPGEIYVGTDITNGGIGFASRIYPIYPYALLENTSLIDLSLPTYDLTHSFDYSYYAISCVGFTTGVCQNFAPNAPNFPLHTDRGDFWVTGQGITFSSFSAVVTEPPPEPTPEPSSLVLMLSGAALSFVRRYSSR